MYLVKVVIQENKGNSLSFFINFFYKVFHTNNLLAPKHGSIKTLASDIFYGTSEAKIWKNAG